MDLFHIKIFKKPKITFSVVYSIQKNIKKSYFIDVDLCKQFLDRPGFNPYWMKNVFPIQNIDLDEARVYVFNELQKEQRKYQATIQASWEWTASTYLNDSFVDSVLELYVCHEANNGE